MVVADQRPIVLFGLERLLRSEPDLHVVERCTNGAQALVAVRRYRPDVLVLDACLSGKGGLAVLRELRREGPSTKTVLIADTLEDEEILEAFRLGVRGMLLREFALRMVVQCIRTVRAGEPWFERRASRRALEVLLRRDTHHRAARGQLTIREAQLVRLVADGLRTKDIAQRLAISAGTVQTHLHRVYRKLRVTNRVELALYARAQALV